MIDLRTTLLIFGCIAFGGLIVAELYSEPGEPFAVRAVGPSRDDAASRPQTRPVRLDEPLAATLARPLFSPNRRPSASGPGETTAGDLTGSRLAGIVIEPNRRLAIFAMAGAKPLILTEGESVSGWQIESITATEVSLVGRGGSKTLQPTLDPNPPAPPRPPARPHAATQPPGPPGQAPMPPARPGAPQPNHPAAQVPAPQRPLQQVNRPQLPATSTPVPQTAPAPGPRVITPPGQAR